MYDVIVVGAGPAGLSAALMLGRCRRRVLVCDTGKPRNAASHAMHGFLSRDGMPPREFLRIAREQLRQYDTVELRDVEVTAAECRDSRFHVTLADGSDARLAEAADRHRRRGQPAGHPGLPAAVRHERVSLSVLRRLGSARSAARDLRPRRTRAGAVARADRLEPRSRAVHGRSVGDRAGAISRAWIATASASARTAWCGSMETIASSASSSRPASRSSDARCSSPPARRSSRSSRRQLGCLMNDKGTVLDRKIRGHPPAGAFRRRRRVARGPMGGRGGSRRGRGRFCHQY